MWSRKQHSIRRSWRFFKIALSHDSLENMIKTNFALAQHHKWSLTEIEMMHPWEREVYVALLLQFIDEQNDRLKK